MTITERLPAADGPEDWASAREFATALESCVRGLAPRARQVWFLRACLERPSREIAALAAVSAPHVDVIVMRARAALAECMAAKGHHSHDVRPGAFALLWSQWQSEQEGSVS